MRDEPADQSMPSEYDPLVHSTPQAGFHLQRNHESFLAAAEICGTNHLATQSDPAGR
jgi:hypothetical protein